MNGPANREGGASAPLDPALARISERKRLGSQLDSWPYAERSEADFRRVADTFNDLLDLIELTSPTTPEGMAASISYLAECIEGGQSVDESRWLGTLAESAARWLS